MRHPEAEIAEHDRGLRADHPADQVEQLLASATTHRLRARTARVALCWLRTAAGSTSPGTDVGHMGCIRVVDRAYAALHRRRWATELVRYAFRQARPPRVLAELVGLGTELYGWRDARRLVWR
jgi:hypothetical protein